MMSVGFINWEHPGINSNKVEPITVSGVVKAFSKKLSRERQYAGMMAREEADDSGDGNL